MRILHVLDHSVPLYSGYSFRTLAILREQRSMGWETFHLTTPKHAVACGTPDVQDEIIDGWQFFRTPPAHKSWNIAGVRELSFMHHLERRLDEIVGVVQPDILHAHSPVLNVIPALRVGRRRGVPVAYEVRAFWEDAAVDHGTTREGSARYRVSKWLETWALKRVGHVTTICDGLKGDIIGRGVSAENVTVVPNAVDVEAFKTSGKQDESLKVTLGLGGCTVIGFIGSFYAYEGLDLMIAALQRIEGERPDVRLLLIGGGPQTKALVAQVAACNLAKKVVFAGRVPHEDIPRYYEIMDVVAYPRHSMRLTELVTPLKPLEAMALGRLVVASDVGGHRELIRHNETGLLFRAGSAESLSSTLRELLQRRDEWSELRSAARRFVEHERTWSASVERYRGVYGRILGRSAHAAA